MTLIDKAEALAILTPAPNAKDGLWAKRKQALYDALAALPARGVGVPESLRKFLRHDGLCGIVGGYGYCTCGLEDALAALAPTDAAQAREAAADAIKMGFLSAAPGEWRVSDIERVTEAILRALEQEG